MATDQDVRLTEAGTADAAVNNVDDGTQAADVAAQQAGPESTPAQEGQPAPAIETPIEPTPAPPVADPSIEEDLRKENTRLSSEAREYRRQVDQVRLENDVSAYAQKRIDHHISQGVEDQTARQLGVLEAQVQLHAFRSEEATLRASRVELSQEFNVPLSELMDQPNENAMRRHAEQYAQTTGPQAKVVQEQNTKIARLEKIIADIQAPAQNFNQASSSRVGSSGDTEINRRFARGEIPFSPAVREARQRLGFGN